MARHIPRPHAGYTRSGLPGVAGRGACRGIPDPGKPSRRRSPTLRRHRRLDFSCTRKAGQRRGIPANRWQAWSRGSRCASHAEPAVGPFAAFANRQASPAVPATALNASDRHYECAVHRLKKPPWDRFAAMPRASAATVIARAPRLRARQRPRHLSSAPAAGIRTATQPATTRVIRDTFPLSGKLRDCYNSASRRGGFRPSAAMRKGWQGCAIRWPRAGAWRCAR